MIPLTTRSIAAVELQDPRFNLRRRLQAILNEASENLQKLPQNEMTSCLNNWFQAFRQAIYGNINLEEVLTKFSLTLKQLLEEPLFLQDPLAKAILDFFLPHLQKSLESLHITISLQPIHSPTLDEQQLKYLRLQKIKERILNNQKRREIAVEQLVKDFKEQITIETESSFNNLQKQTKKTFENHLERLEQIEKEDKKQKDAIQKALKILKEKIQAVEAILPQLEQEVIDTSKALAHLKIILEQANQECQQLQQAINEKNADSCLLNVIVTIAVCVVATVIIQQVLPGVAFTPTSGGANINLIIPF